uniref:AC9 transposase n=1 Tax=Cajanus cajan TaxID=3821 RepID=A0A151UIF2_CAJCA
MLHHLSKCVVLKKLKDNDVVKMIIDHARKLRSREIDQKVVDDLISMAIIQHGLPYNFVEYKWIKELLIYLNPEVRVPSRNIVVSNISKKFHEHKERVKVAMHKSHSRICLSDCWTSITQQGYICLTAHFVDASCKLNRKIIAYCKIEPPHTSHDLAQIFFALLLEWVTRNAKSDDPIIKNMALNMMNKFSKYWDHYCDIIAIGAILDPRMKFEAIWFCYSKIGPSTCEEKINILKEKMYKLFEEYVKLHSNESNTSSSQISPSTHIASFTNDEQVMDAFDVNEENLDLKFFDKLDVLSYWRDRRDRYPNLSKIACDMFSIPITTVASESAFSFDSRVLTKYCSSILPEIIEALFLTQN